MCKSHLRAGARGHICECLKAEIFFNRILGFVHSSGRLVSYSWQKAKLLRFTSHGALELGIHVGDE
jgi:hypothetical protein